MTYTHSTPVLVRVPTASGLPKWEAARVDDNLHPSERGHVPPHHHCVRFADGSRMLFPEHDMMAIPAVTR
ncbi:MAG: hypothetical protein J0H79_15480 [Alphaproteobacteria bacterium]|nr:hypothetical protein [Alphaproteobacteria bacterium]